MISTGNRKAWTIFATTLTMDLSKETHSYFWMSDDNHYQPRERYAFLKEIRVEFHREIKAYLTKTRPWSIPFCKIFDCIIDQTSCSHMKTKLFYNYD